MVLCNRGRIQSVTCEHRAWKAHTKACTSWLCFERADTSHCVLFNVICTQNCPLDTWLQLVHIWPFLPTQSHPFTTHINSPATDWMLLQLHSSHIGWAWSHTSWCACPCSSSGPSPYTAQMCTSPLPVGTGLSAPHSHCTSLPSCTPRWDRLHGVCSVLWWQLCPERTI